MSLKVLEHDIFTVTPIKILKPGLAFAPLGLIDMYNAGGAIEGLKYDTKSGESFEKEGNGGVCERVGNLSNEVVAVVLVEVKGCGRFGSYSSAKPRKCTVGSTPVKFEYDSGSGLVVLKLDHMPEGDKKVHSIEVEL